MMRTKLASTLGDSAKGAPGVTISGATSQAPTPTPTPEPARFVALVRGEDGGLQVRRFDKAEDAVAACAAHEAPIRINPADRRREWTSTHAFAREIGMSTQRLRNTVLKYEIPCIAHGERTLMIPNRICRLIKMYGLLGVRCMALRGEL